MLKEIMSGVSKSQKEQVLLSTGRRIGRLVVQGLNRNEDVVCACDCGETVAIKRTAFLTGKSYQCSSCDAWQSASPVERIIGDRDTYETLMSRARGARDRCENPQNPNWENYGGRGIQFLFPDEETFALCLWVHGWRYGDERTTDRIDVNGAYEPENVRLATPQEQVWNRRVSVVVETDDQTVSLADLANQRGIDTGSQDYAKLSRFVSETKKNAWSIIDAKLDELGGAA